MTKKDLGIPWSTLGPEDLLTAKKIQKAHESLLATQADLRVLERSLELQVDELERLRRRRVELVALGNDTTEAVVKTMKRVERRQRGWDRTWEPRLFELLDKVQTKNPKTKKKLSIEEQYQNLRALARTQGVELPEFVKKGP